jgi:hypothetical protein
MIKVDETAVAIQSVVGETYRRWLLDGQGPWDDLLPVERSSSVRAPTPFPGWDRTKDWGSPADG